MLAWYIIRFSLESSIDKKVTVTNQSFLRVSQYLIGIAMNHTRPKIEIMSNVLCNTIGSINILSRFEANYIFGVLLENCHQRRSSDKISCNKHFNY